MKPKTLSVIAIFILLLAACGTPGRRLLQPGQIVLKPGQSAADVQRGVEIIFVNVLQDSRCPRGVMCIWAGQVQVLLEVRQGTESFQYTLALGDLSDGSINAITVAEYQITLLQVTPFRQVSQTIDPSDYEITLDIQAN